MLIDCRVICNRKISKRDPSSKISLSAPSFCTVYAVSKGKLFSIRPSVLDTNESIKDDCSVDSSCSNNSSLSYTNSSKTGTCTLPFSYICLTRSIKLLIHLLFRFQNSQILALLHLTLTSALIPSLCNGFRLFQLLIRTLYIQEQDP